MSSDNTDRVMQDLARALRTWRPRFVMRLPADVLAECQRIREQLALEQRWRQEQLAMLGLLS